MEEGNHTCRWRSSTHWMPQECPQGPVLYLQGLERFFSRINMCPSAVTLGPGVSCLCERQNRHRNSSTQDFVLETWDLGLMCGPTMFSVHGPQYEFHICPEQSLGRCLAGFISCKGWLNVFVTCFPGSLQSELFACHVIVLEVRLSQIDLANLVKTLYIHPHIKVLQTQFCFLIIVIKI